jgi:hypothetical protein
MGFASGGVDVPTWSFVTRTSVRLGLTELRPPTRPNAKPRALAVIVKEQPTACRTNKKSNFYGTSYNKTTAS